MSRLFPFLLCFFHDPEYFQYLDPRRKDNMERKLFKDYQEWGYFSYVDYHNQVTFMKLITLPVH